MFEHDEHINDLIALVLTGEATDAQQRELGQWRQLSHENEQYFRELEKVYMISVDADLKPEFDAEVALKKVKSRISESGGGSAGGRLIPFPVSQAFLRIAAAILIFAGLSYVGYRTLIQDEVQSASYMAENTVVAQKLPDSTSVFLNKKSSITYKYSSSKRVVELQGEAFFEIAPDPERSFEVHAGELVITDIGTSFNVYAPGNGDSIRVSVTDGEVRMAASGNKFIILKKGEQALYLKQQDEFFREAMLDTNAISYKTKIFVFDNATLDVVTEKLSDVYDVKIVAGDHLKSCRITATFRNENIEEILNIICETLSLELIRQDNQFEIRGNACIE